MMFDNTFFEAFWKVLLAFPDPYHLDNVCTKDKTFVDHIESALPIQDAVLKEEVKMS